MPAHTEAERKSRTLPHLQEGGTAVPREKACQILKDGQVNGQPITGAQRRFVGLICGGDQPTRAEDGAIVVDDRINLALTELALEDPNFLESLGG